MKKFFLDISFIFLFLFFAFSFMNGVITSSKLESEILKFEQNIEEDKIVDTSHGYNSVIEDNVVGLFVKGISGFCIKIIEGFIIIISNLISILL